MNCIESNFKEIKLKRQVTKRNIEDYASNDSAFKKQKLEVLQDLNKDSWCERFKPKKKKELVVNKKKILETEQWLRTLTNTSSNIALFTGPSGCGKLTSLQLCCEELSIKYVEWIPNVTLDYDRENYISQLDTFENFVIRAGRYKSLLTNTKQSLVIVKDIPHLYIREPSKFETTLIKFKEFCSVSIVFIVSDSNILFNLFKDDVKLRLDIKTINFNPITTTNVNKLLKNIAVKSGHQFNSACLNEIILKESETSNGDLRQAIQKLSFLLTKTSTKNNVGNDVRRKDTFIDVFHGLGRVMFPKIDSNGKFIHSPDSITSLFTSCADVFSLMLQENYLKRFDDLRDINQAASYMSTSDLLLNEYSLETEIGLNIIIHGLMISNKNPIKKFAQFDPPKWRKLQNKFTSIRGKIKSNFPDNSENDILIDSVTLYDKLPQHHFNGDQLKLIKEFSIFKNNLNFYC